MKENRNNENGEKFVRVWSSSGRCHVTLNSRPRRVMWLHKSWLNRRLRHSPLSNFPFSFFSDLSPSSSSSSSPSSFILTVFILSFSWLLPPFFSELLFSSSFVMKIPIFNGCSLKVTFHICYSLQSYFIFQHNFDSIVRNELFWADLDWFEAFMFHS